MKQTLLSALVGAVVAVAAMFLFAPGRGTREEPANRDTDEWRSSLERLERRLAQIEQRPTLSAAPRTGTAMPASTAESAPASPSAAGEPARAPEPSATALHPPPNPEQLEGLQGWSKDPDVRRRWLFSSEKDVLATFGTPNGVYAMDLGAQWQYSFGSKGCSLYFDRQGRLLRAEWIGR